MKRYKSISSYFETTSLPLASAIICCGIPLESFSKNSDGRVTFVFNRDDNHDLDQAIQMFWQKALKVEPIAFWEATRFLKSRVREGS